MDTEKLFGIVEALKGDYIEFLKAVVEAESPTADKAGVDKVGRLFAEKAASLGFAVEVYPQRISGDVVVITMNADVGGRPVCLSGHMDTVHPVGSYGSNTVTVADGKIVGPGIADCKGGCVCALWAMDALRQIGYRERPIMLLLQSDEETTSLGSGKDTINYICDRAKDALYFLNLEPCINRSMTLERRGISKIKFTVTGIPCHASCCYNGASAISEAAHIILALEKYREAGGITCSCGIIQGGSAINVVPDQCTFYFDTRFKNSAQHEEILSIVRRLCEEPFVAGTKCTYEELVMRPAMEYSAENYRLFDAINSALAGSGLDELDNINSTGGSDAAYVTNAGIPVVDSLGIIGDKYHTREEYVPIEQIPLCAKRLAAIVGSTKF